ncbi:Retrovirus-related Pol polyprotein from transposon TNT 1-94 [Cucumis melo var. makuwa]|uniref:Retrovirus-related Pol polyprotein from transposon TNT 1-94 n=1 Tax=Cucumis melo var. makuwa TaxID=1194695 RepID=A0A5D3CWR9_CUCMM|nr:Retrovirus-related Pol polyprotein from transposon TNT 1-94 [Cucumis melo var. makuwa]TYK16361.1 Retrovirus-related Pol polyprotein from transposon TNT 1-94 [Cucumis melo var. makuwa]
MPRFNNQNQFRNNHHQAYTQHNSSNGWYPDTSATNHITNDLTNLNYSTNYSGVEQVHVRDGTGLKILNPGHSFLIPFDISISSDNHCPILSMPNVLHVPHIKKNLLSVTGKFYSKDNFMKDYIASH